MNNIQSTQNKKDQLNLLFAQRKLYSSAKNYFTLRTFLAVLLALVGSAMTSSNSNMSLYVALFSVIYAIADIFLFEKIEKHKRGCAARIQEMFDTTVLELPWNNVVAEGRLDSEEVGAVLDKYPKGDYVNLKDWYEPGVSKVTIQTGRFVCQRSSVSWDSKLRNRYLFLLYFISLLVLLSLVFFGKNLTLVDFIIGVMFPTLPLAQLLGRQIKDHGTCKEHTLEIKNKLDSVLCDLIDGKVISDPDNLARVFQDEIYRHRKDCPMVFNWVYWMFRDRQESEMSFNVKITLKKFGFE